MPYDFRRRFLGVCAGVLRDFDTVNTETLGPDHVPTDAVHDAGVGPPELLRYVGELRAVSGTGGRHLGGEIKFLGGERRVRTRGNTFGVGARFGPVSIFPGAFHDSDEGARRRDL